MVGGGCTQFNGQTGAAQIIELVSMDFEWETKFLGAGENLARLGQIESLVFAENVHKWQVALRRVCSPPLEQDGQHRIANQVGVALGIVLEFGGNGMRTEKGNRQIETAVFLHGQQRLE